MFSAFLKFDLRYQWRSPILWIGSALFALMAYAATSTDAVQIGGSIGNVHRNAPFVIVQFLNVFTILGLFISGAFVGGALLRDFEMNTSELFFSKPVKAWEYLLGRFTAGVLVSLLIYLAVALALMLGAASPWIDASRLGPFSLAPYGYGLVMFVIPNLIFSAALIMLFAALTRSILGVYQAVTAFFVMWAIAGTFTRDLDNLWLAALIDPFGARALSLTARYWSAEERNTLLPGLSHYVLANRALWLGVAMALLAITMRSFKAQRTGTGRSWFISKKRQEAAPTKAVAAMARLVKQPTSAGFGASLRQYWAQTRFDTWHVLKSVPFQALLSFGIANLVGGLEAQAPMYDTPLYLVTAQMLDIIRGSYTFLLVIIVMFYAGELVWRDRDVKMDGVVDAFPVVNWVPMASKATALVVIIALFLLFAALCCIGYQLVDGGVALEPGLYLSGLAIQAVPFVLIAWLSLVFQVIANNKYVGYLLTIGIVVSQIVLGTLDFDHNLVSFAGASATPYSDMNGFGHFLKGWAWFETYWLLFTVGCLLVATLFWVRGTAEPFKRRVAVAKSRLHGGIAWALTGSISAAAIVGAFILYTTTVQNTYRASDTLLDLQAEYEKTWRKIEDEPQPRIIATDNDVNIFPAERRLEISGHYVMKNKNAEPLTKMTVTVDPDTTAFTLSPEGAKLIEEDKKFGVYVYQFDTPLAPGATFKLPYTLSIRREGFTNSGAPDFLNYNGTFFNNGQAFPQFGYNPQAEIGDRNERKDRGLPPPRRMPKLETAPRTSTYINDDGDWIDFASTVCTSPDQIAMAPGYLQREWTDGDRRCFRYEMDAPILPFWAYLSANWQVKKDRWNDVAIEVYYDAKHPYNVDRMIEATKKSLAYFTENFGPYQHRQFRILEFPNYATFAQSFPNTIPYSEAIGFIANVDAEDSVDYVFYVTAHELAHQWWAHQVIGANAQGSTVMSETLSQYSALMVMEKEYGSSKMRKFLKYELDGYLRGRGGEILEELPLYKVESSQGYVHYRKGSLVMYRLKDEIGADKINLALRNYLARTQYQEPPYTVSTEFVEELRAVTPPEKQQLITDLFERISFFDNRMVDATTKKRADGKYDVTLSWQAAKKESDGIGKETDASLDDEIDIGIFARASGAEEQDEKVLYLKKHRINQASGSLTITVDELPYDAGIDPYNKLIDRVSNDNRKRVTAAS
ncbi:hypothetical protein C7S18_20775 [Ahniella affigens]|uniref:Uncharacterized protein n=1 Tax=Ahniella affigens TaxID=2021234 RepID=A0A2P1PXC4_9GAMM|nr:M1 family aminopeptidase [Ahniella affigens]AVP99454.1 hypothetical protein C7S18_20775 [Ahniella affigens]